MVRECLLSDNDRAGAGFEMVQMGGGAGWEGVPFCPWGQQDIERTWIRRLALCVEVLDTEFSWFVVFENYVNSSLSDCLYIKINEAANTLTIDWSLWYWESHFKFLLWQTGPTSVCLAGRVCKIKTACRFVNLFSFWRKFLFVSYSPFLKEAMFISPSTSFFL